MPPVVKGDAPGSLIAAIDTEATLNPLDIFENQGVTTPEPDDRMTFEFQAEQRAPWRTGLNHNGVNAWYDMPANVPTLHFVTNHAGTETIQLRARDYVDDTTAQVQLQLAADDAAYTHPSIPYTGQSLSHEFTDEIQRLIERNATTIHWQPRPEQRTYPYAFGNGVDFTQNRQPRQMPTSGGPNTAPSLGGSPYPTLNRAQAGDTTVNLFIPQSRIVNPASPNSSYNRVRDHINALYPDLTTRQAAQQWVLDNIPRVGDLFICKGPRPDFGNIDNRDGNNQVITDKTEYRITAADYPRTPGGTIIYTATDSGIAADNFYIVTINPGLRIYPDWYSRGDTSFPGKGTQIYWLSDPGREVSAILGQPIESRQFYDPEELTNAVISAPIRLLHSDFEGIAGQRAPGRGDLLTFQGQEFYIARASHLYYADRTLMYECIVAPGRLDDDAPNT